MGSKALNPSKSGVLESRILGVGSLGLGFKDSGSRMCQETPVHGWDRIKNLNFYSLILIGFK